MKKYFKLGLLGVIFLSLYTGLADSDWYWQVKLGESIVKHGRFNDFSSLVWIQDLGYYLDHEWLSNVIFYLLSLLPCGLMLTKLLLVTMCCIASYLFIKAYDKENSSIIVITTVLLLMICSITVFKIKPYMFSFVFLLLELYFLGRYPLRNSKMGLFVISVLWVNMHGSYPLYLCVLGLYLLMGVFESGFSVKESIITLIVNFFGSFITPFGYNLVLFDLSHNNDSIMKTLIKDWRALDCKESFGIAIFLIIVLSILVLSFTKSKTKFSICFSLAMLFMTLGSARHVLYFSVSLIYLLVTSSVSVDVKTDDKIVKIGTYLAFIFGVSSSLSLLTVKNFRQEYMFNYVDESTVENIKSYYEDIDYKGLFLNSNFNAILGDGVKTFTCGIYPIVSDEVKNELYLTYYSSTEDIEKIIDYYNLTGFVVDKYSNFEGYPSNSVLYQYLSASDNYICLNDTDFYGFFVKKSMAINSVGSR